MNYDENAVHHFLADYDDLPNLAVELCRRVEDVPTMAPEPWSAKPDDFNEDGEYTGEAPHEVFATTWKHYNAEGVLTQPRFFRRLHGALDDMAERLKQNGVFIPWAMRNRPPTTVGRAYHDFRHEIETEDRTLTPVDVRIIIEYGVIELEPEVRESEFGKDLPTLYGLKFHLVTLLERGSYGR